MSRQYFEIGATSSTLVNVESMTTEAPNMAPAVTFRPYQDVLETGDGGRKGIGSAVFTWDFGFVYADMMSSFQSLCSGAAADVYIRTRKENQAETSSGQYSYYAAKMIWPETDSYQFKSGKYQPFQLQFINPVVYTP